MAQFTALSALVLSLATGLVAFQSSALIERKLSGWGYTVGVGSTLLLVTSMGLGLWCGWNRLEDFLLTAKVARGETQHRERAAELGNISKTLLAGQLWAFALGTVLVGARLLL